MATKQDIWTMTHKERDGLLAAISSLSDEHWNTPSRCADWSVRDATSHVVVTFEKTKPKFFGGLATSGFSIQKMFAKDIASMNKLSTSELFDRYRASKDGTNAPPGPVVTWLGEIVVHSEDICQPLGIKLDHDPEALRTVADFYKGSNLLIGSKSRIGDLSLVATNDDWRTGNGPKVKGPLLSLVGAMTGRTSALPDLEGDGVATIKSRMSS